MNWLIALVFVLTIVGMTAFVLSSTATPEVSELSKRQQTYQQLSEFEKVVKSYPDLWDRYLNLQFGSIPKRGEIVILTEDQAKEFVSLTLLPEFQVMAGDWDDVINRAKEES